jgi:two-component system phosphate regulon response regulator PhoB
MLAERAGRVQTREILIADVWGDEVTHSGRIVDTTIKRLRRKIASAGCEIKTVRGVGYKLVSSIDDG